MLNGHHDLANSCTERKRKNSVSSCVSSSHSTESGVYAGSEESPNQELQAFMLEEYTLNSEQKYAPCQSIVYLPIKKQLNDDSPFTVKIKLRPLTSDEKEKVKTKSQCESKTETDQTQSIKEIESSSRQIEHNEREEDNLIENGKSPIAFSEDSNAEIKLEISSED